jgi:hypothetical protein
MIDGRDVGAPQQLCKHPKTTVGAGLPAMAAEQSPLMVADTSLSLASQLPQFFLLNRAPVQYPA